MEQTLMDKLTILADSAKYDVACTSSGVERAGKHGSLGSCAQAGICHAFTPDGRCVSLLKVLYSNVCSYDCSYCVNRRSNDRPRATFTPRELAELTIGFYRRNYIEGLFLSSAVLISPDYTTERMLKTLRLLRNEYHFGGYIHAKAIPGTSPELLQQLRNAGCKTAVVSNKADYAVQELCKQYFDGMFDFAVGERKNILKKPAPDAVNEVLQQLQTDHSQAVYIGDSDVDVETAKNAKMDGIFVDWGFRSRDFLLEHGAKTIVSQPEELAEKILG